LLFYCRIWRWNCWRVLSLVYLLGLVDDWSQVLVTLCLQFHQEKHDSEDECSLLYSEAPMCISYHVLLPYGLIGFLSGQQHGKTLIHPCKLALFDLSHQKEPTTCATPRATCKKVKNTTSVAKLFLMSASNQSSDCGGRDWVDRSRRPKHYSGKEGAIENSQERPKLQRIPPIAKKHPNTPRPRPLKMHLQRRDPRPQMRKDIIRPVRRSIILHERQQHRIKRIPRRRRRPRRRRLR
jgi:hypothetical protein